MYGGLTMIKHVSYVRVFYFLAQYICTLYIPDFAISQGIPGAESAVLVSFIGVTNTLGRILTGFIVDFLHISSITLYLIAFVVVTIGTFLLPLCSSFLAIAVYSVVSGFCVGKTIDGITLLIFLNIPMSMTLGKDFSYY